MAKFTRLREWAAGLLERDEPHYSAGLIIKGFVETWRSSMESIGFTTIFVGAMLILPEGEIMAEPWVPEILREGGIALIGLVLFWKQVRTVYSEVHCDWPGS